MYYFLTHTDSIMNKQSGVTLTVLTNIEQTAFIYAHTVQYSLLTLYSFDVISGTLFLQHQNFTLNKCRSL